MQEQERLRRLNTKFGNAFEAQKFDEAYEHIFELASITTFKHQSINDALFCTLAALDKYKEAYKITVHICNQLLHEDSRNIAALLYYYQLAAFLKKKLSRDVSDALLTTIKAHLLTCVSDVRGQFSLFPQSMPKKGERIRIGHVIGLVSPGHAPTKTVLAQLKYLDKDLFTPFIFTTEWAADWFLARGSRPTIQSHYAEFNKSIEKDYGVRLHIADISGNFLTRCVSVCKKILQENIDILVVNSTDAEAITLFLAMIKPAPYSLNTVFAAPMHLDNFDAYIVLQEDDFIDKTSIPQFYIPATTDIQEEITPRLEKSTAEAIATIVSLKTRFTISGTFGNLFKIDNDGYCGALGAFLQTNKNVHHIFVGKGDFHRIKQKLAPYGVLERISYFGFQKNIKPFMEILDLYLASFPYPGHTCELECMALGKPVVSMAWDKKHHYNAGARAVGLSECIANKNDVAAYTRIASTFIQQPQLREAIARKLQTRFNDLFSPRQHVYLLEQIYIKMRAGVLLAP